MISDAIAALNQIFSPPFRSALWKTLGLTLALLALAWMVLDKLIVAYAIGATGWIASTLSFATGIGLFFMMAYLIAPASSLVAGLFLDELSERVEAGIGPVGRALPAGAAIWIGIRFAALSILVNAIALLVFLLPGLNITVFVLANAYLFSREYFEFAALRFRPSNQVETLRRRHGPYLFVCGLPIALMVMTPVLNLLTPMFAVAYMTRVHSRISREGGSLAQPAS